MAITQSKPGIFLSQPVLQSIPMNPTPCKTHWNSAGSFMSAEPADSRFCATKWKTTITTCLPLRPSPRKSNSEVEKQSVRCALPPGCLWLDLAVRKSLSGNTFCVLPSWRGLRPVCFKFEGISYKITIEDVKLFPQGYSAIALHPELVQNEPSVLLMDIGGWTVDLMRLDNGVPNAATCRSLELGMIRCIDETKEQVRRDTGLSVTDAQVERVLAGKSCSMDEDARNIIQKQGRLYTERLLSAAMESGFDLKAIPVVMLGGGASVVKGNVSEQDSLCRVFALIDDKVNAEGFERILGQFSGGVGKA